MPQNKNALIRYRTIDRCLQNHYRQWTLEDLIDACSDALYEAEGRTVNVSKRTIQLNIQMMRSEKLGYMAPIEVYERKYYRYADPDYSITDIPLVENDMQILMESIEVLKQFKDFSLFAELGGVLQKLEDKIHTQQGDQTPIIHLNKNDRLRGLAHLDVLYQAILKKLVLKITYQSFKARKAQKFRFHPFILKEYNNRWFLVGRSGKKKPLLTLALDRIQHIDYDLKKEALKESFDADAYYQNTIGVTVLSDAQLEDIILEINAANAPYVLTKPFHSSQEIVEEKEDGSVLIKLRVHQNLELERQILGFGGAIKVLKPKGLKKRIKRNLKKALEQYR